MLEFMRKCSQTLVVRLLLFVLVMTFVVWGVGDVLRGTDKQTVATVDGVDISYAQYHQVLEQHLAQFRQAYGNSFTLEQMQQLGLDREVLERMINDQVIEHRLKAFKIGVDDDIVQAMIMSNQNFYNEAGKFDPELFSTILKKNGMTEQRYVQMVREQQSGNLFLSSFSVAPPAPDMAVWPLFSHRYEERVADVLVLSSAGSETIAEPTETQLVQFYNDHADKFTIPELRKVSYIQFDQSVIKDSDPVTDERVKTEYESRKSEFSVEPTQTLDQYVFDDEKQAQQAYDELISHKEVKGKVELGAVTKQSLPAEVQEAVFSLAKGEVSHPIKSTLGWHIFIVKDVTAASVKSFESVKESLRQELKASQHADAFYKWMGEIENQLSSGIPLEDVAKTFNLAIHTIDAVDNHGMDIKGQKIKALPDPGVFLPTVFKLDAMVESGVTTLSDNQTYVSARVDKIMPSRAKALDEAKGYATQLWKEEEKSKILKASAEKIVEALRAGNTTIEQASQQEHAALYAAKTIKRFDNPPLNASKKQSYPADWLQALFSEKPQGITNAYLLEDGSYIVGRLVSVIKADKTKGAVSANMIREELQKTFVDESMEQYLRYLKMLYKVDRNEALLQVKAVSDAQ